MICIGNPTKNGGNTTNGIDQLSRKVRQNMHKCPIAIIVNKLKEKSKEIKKNKHLIGVFFGMKG